MEPEEKTNPWLRIVQSVQKKVDANSFETWFEPTGYIGEEGDALYIKVPNSYFRDWLSFHYSVLLNECAKDLFGKVFEIKYIFDETPSAFIRKSPEDRKTKTGAVLNPINIRLHPKEIAYIINHAESRALFFHSDFTPMVQAMREGLESVSRMAARIREMGGRVNRSCGFHVHVGFNRDEVEALVRLVYLVANIETGLVAATGLREREGNHFCRSIRVGFTGIRDDRRRVRSIDGLRQKESRVSNRYHTLNLSNLLAGNASKPTAEFRVFAGTLNGTKMRAYIQLALGAVQMAAEDAHRVKWESAPRPYAFPGGRGESAVRQMLCMLGWSRNVSVSYGKKDRAYGVIDAEGLPAMKKLLVQLGRKFDGGPRRASDVVVDE